MDYNPYAPPRAEAAPLPAHGLPGTWTIVIQVVLLVGLIGLHSLALLGVAVQMAEGRGPAIDQPAPPGERAGEWFAYLVIAAWGPISMLWAAANIVGLVRRARWSYRSLFAYWIVNLVVCLCFPFGVIGLVHLMVTRPRLAAAPPSPY